jgi:hypothetical protein
LKTMAEQYNVDVQEGAIEDLTMEKFEIKKWPPEQVAELQRVREVQREQWAWIDAMEQGASLAELRVQGAAINAAVRNRHGRPALHVAASCSGIEVVLWLVEELGVDAEMRDEQGRRAEEVARLAGKTDVEHLLKRRRASHVVACFSQVGETLRRRQGACMLRGPRRTPAVERKGWMIACTE